MPNTLLGRRKRKTHRKPAATENNQAPRVFSTGICGKSGKAPGLVAGVEAFAAMSPRDRDGPIQIPDRLRELEGLHSRTQNFSWKLARRRKAEDGRKYLEEMEDKLDPVPNETW